MLILTVYNITKLQYFFIYFKGYFQIKLIKINKCQIMGRNSVKCELLDLPRLLHSRTHTSCGVPNKNNPAKIPAQTGKGLFSTHLWLRSYWQLLAGQWERITLFWMYGHQQISLLIDFIFTGRCSSKGSLPIYLWTVLIALIGLYKKKERMWSWEGAILGEVRRSWRGHIRGEYDRGSLNIFMK